MVVGSHQTAILLGVDLGLLETDIDYIAKEATRRFIKAYSG